MGPDSTGADAPMNAFITPRIYTSLTDRTHGWHRHMTLCMAAAAFLARLAAQLRHAAGSKANERSPLALAA